MKILVVDDEFVALTKLTTILSKHGKCDAATNGSQAFKLFGDAITNFQPYNLVTIDINLPDMNGLELLKSLIGIEKDKKVIPAKKIVISADSSTDSIHRAVRNACDAFLVKPVQRQVLDKKLKELGLV